MNEFLLIALLVYGVAFAWLLALSHLLPFINCDPEIIESRERLVVLIIASMTVAATLLTTTPEDKPVKQFAFLLIAIAGVVAAIVAIDTKTWGLFGFLVGGLIPVLCAFIFVCSQMFRGSQAAFWLLVAGALLVWAASFLLNTKLGMSLATRFEDSTFFGFIVALAVSGVVSAIAGAFLDFLKRRGNDPAPNGSDAGSS